MTAPRSTLREVRNPILALPAAKAIMASDAPWRPILRQLLLELRDDCRARAQKAWITRKPPVAAYWAACGVVAGHIAKVMK